MGPDRSSAAVNRWPGRSPADDQELVGLVVGDAVLSVWPTVGLVMVDAVVDTGARAIRFHGWVFHWGSKAPHCYHKRDTGGPVSRIRVDRRGQQPPGAAMYACEDRDRDGHVVCIE